MTVFPPSLEHESGRELELDPCRLVVAFRQRQESTHGTLHAALSLGIKQLTLERVDDENIHQAVNHTEKLFWVRTGTNTAFADDDLMALRDNLGDALDWIGPVYHFAGEEQIASPILIFPDTLLIRLSEGANQAILDERLAAFSLKHIEQATRYLAGFRCYWLRREDRSDANSIFRIREKLRKDEYRQQGIHAVVFDYMPMLIPIYQRPTGTMNLDPSWVTKWWDFVTEFWKITYIRIRELVCGVLSLAVDFPPPLGTGITVAVIDYTGLELNHPALVGAYVQGATFSPDYSDFDDITGRGLVIIDEGPSGGGAVNAAPSSAHGTLCAGIIGARYRPDYPTGVVGLSPGSRIMPLRVVSYKRSLVAAAMNYAADPAHRARVISISKSSLDLDGNDPMTNPVAAAIDNVTRNGVVVCAATMNDNARVIHYPAGHPSVIACGACNTFDDRCHPNDWGTGEGSNYGDQLSVVARGVAIPTTDLSGAGGWNSAPSPAGDYTDSQGFQGTSSATPQVAALAANLMSRFSALRGSDAASSARVKEIIERSARKVGKATVAGSRDPMGNPTPVGATLTYSTVRAYGGWEQEMGFGVIDHTAAMQKATELLAAVTDTQPPATPGGLLIR